MGRYTGPKDRISRREGFDLFNAGAKLTRLTVTPGVHGPKGQMKKQSQFGRQLREKQKVKRMYGLFERQFVKYVDEALKTTGNTFNVLFSLLERRLDNTIYRLGFAPSRPAARQLVSHAHVFVNGKKVNIPSYQVRVGDVLTLDVKAMSISTTAKAIADKDITAPDWLERKAAAGKVVRLPMREDVKETIADQDIVEFYSR